MKKINKAFLALAAALAFGSFASAQDNPYLMDFGKGIGYNKTVLMNHETGQRTIRLETFAMGGGERKAIPSDIVLVLDNSGSMQYYYLGSGDMSKYKNILTQDEASALTSMGEPVLVPEDQHFLEAYSYTHGGPGNVDGTNPNNSASYKCFSNEGASLENAFRYAKYNGKYYKLFHRTETDGSTYYYICFRLEDNSLMYLDGNGYIPASANDGHGPRTSRHATSQVFQFKGIADDPSTPEDESTLLYRAVNRMDKLVEGVNRFIDAIAANNATIADELGDKTGNQIAIVAFGDRIVEDYDPSYTGVTPNSRIIKAFTPVTGSNVNDLKQSLNRMGFNGNTSTGYGYMLASEAFNLLRYGTVTPGDPATGNLAMDSFEMNSDGQYINQDGQPINVSGGQPVVNRSKIVVMFTDGYSTMEYPFTSSDPYHFPSNPSTETANWGHAKYRSIYFSNEIKTPGIGNVNGKIFTIGLTPTASDQAYLEHLSSNYKNDVGYTGSMSTEAPPASSYTGTSSGSNKYYKDAGHINLSDIFDSIASEAGGSSSSVNSTSVLNVDILSKSFQIEGGASADRIKLSIAQCLGLDPDHTYLRDGATKHYLAFSEPIPIANCTNVRLWVDTTDETSGTTTWATENVNLTDGVSVSVTEEGKVTVVGFDYGKYWCGLDADTSHDNDLLYNPDDYGHYELQTGTYIPGYRGFKLIIDIPITPQDNAIGGSHVKTNEPGSGLYDPSDLSEPMISYPAPETIVSPVNLWVQKEGLKKGESASFTILRKSALDPSDTYKPYTNMIITGETDTDGSSKPVLVKLLNLDASYYYMIQEDGWSWTYTKAPVAPTTETLIENPIVITNTPKPGTLPKHAESIAKNQMGTAAGVGGSTTTISTREHTTVTP